MNPEGVGGFGKQDPKKRLLSHVTVDEVSGCWLWTGRRKDSGYGQSWLDGVQTNAHRIAYIVWRGPVPDGLEVDHICHVRACINPDHLQLATRHENVRRQLRHLAPHCANGHDRSVHTVVVREGGRERRRCRACARVTEARKAERRRGGRPSRGPARKLTTDAVADIRRLARRGYKLVEIAAIHGVTPSNVGQIVRGKTWKEAA